MKIVASLVSFFEIPLTVEDGSELEEGHRSNTIFQGAEIESCDVNGSCPSSAKAT